MTGTPGASGDSCTVPRACETNVTGSCKARIAVPPRAQMVVGCAVARSACRRGRQHSTATSKASSLDGRRQSRALVMKT